jgi:hypothetical protein
MTKTELVSWLRERERKSNNTAKAVEEDNFKVIKTASKIYIGETREHLINHLRREKLKQYEQRRIN